MLTVIDIALNKLVPFPRNIRRTGNAISSSWPPADRLRNPPKALASVTVEWRLCSTLGYTLAMRNIAYAQIRHIGVDDGYL